MKKRNKIVLIIILSFIGLFIIFGNIDYHFRVKHNKPPLLAIKVANDEIKRWIGLGYSVYNCPDYDSNNIGIGNGIYSHSDETDNNKYRMQILSFTYACVSSFDVEVPEKNTYEVVYKKSNVKTGLFEIGRDKKFIYYIEKSKMKDIILEFDDGSKINLQDALDSKRYEVHELISRGLEVYKKEIKNN